MNANISVFVICAEAIMYLLLYNLHDFTFNVKSYQTRKKTFWRKCRGKKFFSYTLSDKTKSDKILVTSKDFGHFCLTNNFTYFEISKYDQISILRNSDYIFSREKLKNR